MQDSLAITPTVTRPPPDHDERLLAVRFARGDERAFDQVAERYQDRVVRLAFRLMGSAADAEDVVQEVFLAALEGRRKFRGESSLATWLTAITIRQCRRFRRRRMLDWSKLTRIRSRGETASPDAQSDEPIVREETARQVRAAVQKLPGRYREVVVLRYLEEMPTAEVAEILGLARGTVDVRLSRARKRLEKLLSSIIES